jgi:hypothetical protein
MYFVVEGKAMLHFHEKRYIQFKVIGKFGFIYTTL